MGELLREAAGEGIRSEGDDREGQSRRGHHDYPGRDRGGADEGVEDPHHQLGMPRHETLHVLLRQGQEFAVPHRVDRHAADFPGEHAHFPEQFADEEVAAHFGSGLVGADGPESATDDDTEVVAGVASPEEHLLAPQFDPSGTRQEVVEGRGVESCSPGRKARLRTLWRMRSRSSMAWDRTPDRPVRPESAGPVVRRKLSQPGILVKTGRALTSRGWRRSGTARSVELGGAHHEFAERNGTVVPLDDERTGGGLARLGRSPGGAGHFDILVDDDAVSSTR